MKMPIVCLAGRTNVGKSALFNRMTSRKVRSLVFDKEHVTRDYVESVVTRQGARFQLIDTGGVFSKSSGNLLDDLGREKAFEVVERAEVVLLVCDAHVGVLDEDLNILRLLRKQAKNLVLVVNKVDNHLLELEASAFQSLGVSDLFYTSAVHGSGVCELLDFLTMRFGGTLGKASKGVAVATEELAIDDENSDEEGNDFPVAKNEDSIFNVAIIGKPNVGKSSLLNLLSHSERSIVSPIEGTTREAIGIDVSFNHQLISLTDTPGVRRQASVKDPLEEKMVKSALAGVRVSDMVILVVDASKGALCNQELKLLDYALSCRKAVLLLLNKIDLLTEVAKTNLAYDLERYDFMLRKVQIIRTSCINAHGIGKVFTALQALWKRCKMTFDAEHLNNIVRDYLLHRPLYKQNRMLRVFQLRQVAAAKAPTFQMRVCDPRLFAAQELSCIENVLRKNLDLRGCPVVIHPVRK